MANLSDVLAPTGDAPVEPGWIAALAPGEGFRAGAMVASPLLPDLHTSPGEPDAIEAALADAYARGARETRAAMAAEQDADAAARGQLALAFARLDAEAALALRQILAQAVASLCEQVIEPARIDHAALASRCGALAAQLGERAAACALHLHPDDVPLLAASTAESWAIRTDPDLPRGTLRLEGPDGVLSDGPEDWRRLIAEALGQ